MIRLNLVVEGQTEETYVRDELALHLAAGFQVSAVASSIQTGRRRGTIFRGGLSSYAKLRNDVINWLNQDKEAWVTTMIDLYRLPSDFPERTSAAKTADPVRRVERLESAFAQDIDSRRFIPYIQLHEFEALLFTDISRLRAFYLDSTREIEKLHIETADLPPETINDGEMTAPSKRIQKYVPAYQKVASGATTARDIGLATIRSKCPHFDQWITKLESLGVAPEN
ncbi:MAG TPA: DUF4276 family protein [Candidatus Limnocylindria bacterium]|jgi:hypothetical protein|nr:DUF4276 family protein [Candidatus Limnocylindria bacterium]